MAACRSCLQRSDLPQLLGPCRCSNRWVHPRCTRHRTYCPGCRVDYVLEESDELGKIENFCRKRPLASYLCIVLHLCVLQCIAGPTTLMLCGWLVHHVVWSVSWKARAFAKLHTCLARDLCIEWSVRCMCTQLPVFAEWYVGGALASAFSPWYVWVALAAACAVLYRYKSVTHVIVAVVLERFPYTVHAVRLWNALIAARKCWNVVRKQARKEMY